MSGPTTGPVPIPTPANPMSIGPQQSVVPSDVLTPERIGAILAAAKALGEHPLFEDHVRAVEEYRRERDATDAAGA